MAPAPPQPPQRFFLIPYGNFPNVKQPALSPQPRMLWEYDDLVHPLVSRWHRHGRCCVWGQASDQDGRVFKLTDRIYMTARSRSEAIATAWHSRGKPPDCIALSQLPFTSSSYPHQGGCLSHFEGRPRGIATRAQGRTRTRAPSEAGARHRRRPGACRSGLPHVWCQHLAGTRVWRGGGMQREQLAGLVGLVRGAGGAGEHPAPVWLLSGHGVPCLPL